MTKTNFRKKCLSLLISLILSININAYDIVIDGLCYSVVNLEDMTVSLTYCSRDLKGDLVVPDTIAFKGKKLTVVNIGDQAFYCCEKLTSVVLPNTIKSIGEWAFAHCSKLTSIKLPDSLLIIDNDTFRQSNLVSITLPKTLTAIGSGAFSGCYQLTSITIPKSIKEIHDLAFEACSSLKEVIIMDSEDAIYMPSSDNVFKYCYGIETLYLGRSVYNIQSKDYHWPLAFFYASKITIVQGGLVNSERFTNLREVESLSKNPLPITFTNSVYLNATLYVPVGTKAIYEATDGWKQFWTIEERKFETSNVGSSVIDKVIVPSVYYNIRGEKLDKLQKGMNIVRDKNGNARKIIIK